MKKRKAKKSKAVTVAKPLPPPQSMLEVIGRASMDARVDPAKMRELLNIQMEIEKRDAKTAFDVAMIEAQTEMPMVLKDTRNDVTNSYFVKLETLSKEMDPIIHKHGFSLEYGMATPRLADHYCISCLVSHKGGHSRDYFLDLPTDDVGMKGNPNKTPLHAAASTVTYGRRILKTIIFDVRQSSFDDDGNRGGAMPITDDQAKAVREALAEVKGDEGKFCKWLGIDTINQMPTRLLGQAMIGISDIGKRKAAKVPAT